jgi:hypothetical protein
MMINFFDRQDESNPMNGVEIHDEQQLEQAISAGSSCEPHFCELIGDAGYTLLIGVAKEIGCVQFSNTNGEPPYLMAVGSTSAEANFGETFLIRNTPTEVPMRYCLPRRTVIEIASDFINTQERSPRVAWEEI